MPYMPTDASMNEMDELTCLLCGDNAYELQLCREHLDEYYDWKVRRGVESTSRNRVDEFIGQRIDS